MEGTGGPDPPGKSQAVMFLGPIASRGRSIRPSVKHVDD